jgi:hypothetical protein
LIISLCFDYGDPKVIFITEARKEKMAKIKLDPLFAAISGTIGDFVFKKSRKGEAIVARRPKKSNAEPSEAQKAQRERFKLANAYAKAAMADPDVRAFYEERAAEEGQGAFALARIDYFNGEDLLSKK